MTNTTRGGLSVLLLALGAAVPVGCASGGEGDDPPVGFGGTAGSGGAAGSASGGTAGGASGGTAGGAAGGAAATGGTSGAGGGTGGSGGTGGDGSTIYVTTSGDDQRDGKSPAQAVKTIAAGITRALACAGAPCEVHVAAGKYTGAVTLMGGARVLGGYGQDFSSRDGGATELTSNDEKTVIAQALTSDVLLDGLTITGATLSGTDGRSSYALWVASVADRLTLQDVIVKAGRGADGGVGSDGLVLACDAHGGLGGTATDCDSANGDTGSADGDPVRDGGGGPGGSNNCPSACPLVGGDGISDGTSGTAGGNGDPGVAGLPSSDTAGSFTSAGWVATLGSPGTRGGHGTGGGGGGSGGTKRIRACFGCGTLLGGRGGDGAPGGCGGDGGSPGRPGGGAFALVVIDSSITLDGTTLQGGQGGKGGKGGAGADGAAGGTVVDTGRGDAITQKCGAIDYRSGAGAVGGTGGHGGPGGGGSGGPGGAAITLVQLGSSSIERLHTVTVTKGAPGFGGDGGDSVGAAGIAGYAGAAETEHTY